MLKTVLLLGGKTSHRYLYACHTDNSNDSQGWVGEWEHETLKKYKNFSEHIKKQKTEVWLLEC